MGVILMDECIFCGFYDPDYGCVCYDDFGCACPSVESELTEEDFKVTRENQKIEEVGNKL